MTAPETPPTAPASPKSSLSPLRRVLRTLVIGFSITASLLVFPSVVPWMIAAWLVAYTFLVIKNRPAWIPLSICLAVLVIRLVPRTPAMLSLGTVFVILIAIRYRGRLDPRPMVSWKPLLLGVPWVLWTATYVEHRRIITCNRPHLTSFHASSPIVCVGDSLTDGMRPDLGYPDALNRMLPNPVINEGVSGIASTQALDLIPRVLAHQPAIVVIELGGHDFLKGHTRASTKANLVLMIDRCREHNAEVILMEIPRGFMIDPFASLEREIAYEKDVQLVEDTWLRQVILMSPIAPPGRWLAGNLHLSDDGIHSNPRGSRVIAQRVARSIEQLVSRVEPNR